MPATLAPELPANIVAIEEIEVAPEPIVAPAPPEQSHDDALCYLCPPGTPDALAKRQCHYCERPICNVHRRLVRVSCATHYDACPDCMEAKNKADEEAYRRFLEGAA